MTDARVLAEIAFLKAEQVNGGSMETYQHVPDPTAEDPEAEGDQLLCASFEKCSSE